MQHCCLLLALLVCICILYSARSRHAPLRCLKKTDLVYHLKLKQTLWAGVQTKSLFMKIRFDLNCVADGYLKGFKMRASKHRLKVHQFQFFAADENEEKMDVFKDFPELDAAESLIVQKFGKPFYFVQLENGTIAYTLHPIDEDHEILLIKKSIAASFQIALGKRATVVSEVVPSNKHRAHYSVENGEDGLTRVHLHYSSADIERFAQGSDVNESDVGYNEDKDVVLNGGFFRTISGNVHASLIESFNETQHDGSFSSDEVSTGQEVFIGLHRQKRHSTRKVSVIALEDRHGLKTSSVEVESLRGERKDRSCHDDPEPSGPEGNSKGITKGPAKSSTEDYRKSSTEVPAKGPKQGPTKLVTKGPTKVLPKGPATVLPKGSTKILTEILTKGPTNGPTTPQRAETDIPTSASSAGSYEPLSFSKSFSNQIGPQLFHVLLDADVSAEASIDSAAAGFSSQAKLVAFSKSYTLFDLGATIEGKKAADSKAADSKGSYKIVGSLLGFSVDHSGEIDLCKSFTVTPVAIESSVEIEISIPFSFVTAFTVSLKASSTYHIDLEATVCLLNDVPITASYKPSVTLKVTGKAEIEAGVKKNVLKKPEVKSKTGTAAKGDKEKSDKDDDDDNDDDDDDDDEGLVSAAVGVVISYKITSFERLKVSAERDKESKRFRMCLRGSSGIEPSSLSVVPYVKLKVLWIKIERELKELSAEWAGNGHENDVSSTC